MNKKNLFLLFAFLCLFFSKLALANDPLEDYLYQEEEYQKAYAEFKTSRDKYLKYQALTAQEGAVESTKALIVKRNEALRAYFLALKDKLKNTPGIVETQQDDGLLAQLDQKIVWLEEETEEVKSLYTPSLEDLFVLSDRIEDKEAELKNLGYQVLAEALLGKIRTLQAESVSLTTLLKEEVSQSQSEAHADQLNLWIKEVGVKNYLAQKEIEAAEINLWQLRVETKPASMATKFANIQTDVDDAKIQLQQAIKFQKEIYEELNND